MNNVDKEYFRLLNTVLNEGKPKKNRTGIDTIGVFGEQAKYDVNLNAFPILTTKKVWFKGIVHELLWFIKGDTNIKYLVDNDVHIWDEWAYAKYNKLVQIGNLNETNSEKTLSPYRMVANGSNAEIVQYQKYNQIDFINRIKSDKSFADKWGELGEGTYGSMWRTFPFYTIDDEFKNSVGVSGEYVEQWAFGKVDQLKKVIEKLKTNPDDRRIIVSAWHPYWVDHCALPPCHCLFHFHTEELTNLERFYLLWRKIGDELKGKSYEGYEHLLEEHNISKRKLNCLLYQRSCDLPLGVPFNITSYSLLTAMIAHSVNMVPGKFVHTYGDLHIYNNQLDGIKEQLKREPRTLPKLWLNPEVKNLFDFKYEDIKLTDYNPHPKIEMPIAV